MKKIILSFLLCLPMLLPGILLAKKVQPAFSGTFQYAQGYESGDMANYFENGVGGRTKLFIGVKLPAVKYLSAAGLGLDLTYLQFEGKASGDHYNMYQWDWFKLPIPKLSIGFLSLVVEAGLFWNVIDVKINEYEYEQTSIRPGFSAGGGLSINFGKHFSLDINGRYSWMFRDREKMTQDKSLVVTMDYASAFAGFTIRL